MNSSNSRRPPTEQPEQVDSDPLYFLNNSQLPISNLILEYAADEKEKAILMNLLADEKGDGAQSLRGWDNQALGFFDRINHFREALKKSTASALIAGNVDVAIELVRNNPWLINEDMEGTALMGERSITMTGKPLQIAARLGDFNPFEMEEEQEPFGAVERLIALDLLSAEAIENQLEEVFPPGWEDEDTMGTLRAAVESLVSDIEALDIDQDARWDDMRPLAEGITQQCRAIVLDHQAKDTGFVFDLRILDWFIDQFWGDGGWKDRLGDVWSAKCDLLFAVGFGSLQAADTACGLQLHRLGIYNVVVNKALPDRSLHFSSACPDFYPKLGSSYFLSVFNGWAIERGGLVGERPGALRRWLYQKSYQTKTAALQKFMRTSARSHNRSRCVIL